MIWETRPDGRGSGEDDALADRFARSETPAQRRRRVAAKAVDPETARAVRAMLARRPAKRRKR